MKVIPGNRLVTKKKESSSYGYVKRPSLVFANTLSYETHSFRLAGIKFHGCINRRDLNIKTFSMGIKDFSMLDF